MSGYCLYLTVNHTGIQFACFERHAQANLSKMSLINAMVTEKSNAQQGTIQCALICLFSEVKTADSGTIAFQSVKLQ